MTFSGHLAFTSLALSLSNDPAVVLPLSLGLHFVADAIPHAEWREWKVESWLPRILMIADTLVSIILVIGLFNISNTPAWLITTAIIAGLFPDLIDTYARKRLPWFRFIHEWLHTWPLSPQSPIDWGKTVTGRTPTVIKVATQAFIIILSLYVMTI